MIKISLLKSLTLVFSPAIFFLLFSTVGAYSIYDVSLDLSPANPAPNETVTATLKSYTISLDASKITWTINGSLKQSGVGQKILSFNAGKNDSESNILAIITAPNGEVIKKSAVVNPIKMDLYWEADSYTPPFYKGKALYPNGADIKIIALSGLSGISPDNLTYKWKNNGKNLTADSGFGKSTLTIKGSSLLSPIFVEVEASTPDGSKTSYGKISIDPQPSKTIVYENSPLYGILFNKAVSGTLSMPENEIGFTAIPYFFSSNYRKNSSLNYFWKMNGQILEQQEDPTSVILRKTDDFFEGKAEISFGITDNLKVFQSSNGKFALDFSPANE